MCFSLENLMFIKRTGLPILVKLIDLNSIIVFLSQTTLLRWLIFLLGSLIVTLTVLLFWIYLFLLTPVFVLQWISIHREILIMLLPQFPLTFSRAVWDGLHDNLRDVPWKDIFKLSICAATGEFVSGFRLESMYISLIISIRSNLIYLYGFQKLVLLS